MSEDQSQFPISRKDFFKVLKYHSDRAKRIEKSLEEIVEILKIISKKINER